MDNELALQGGGINASTVSEALTQPLEKVLLEAADAKTAAREVGRSPKLLAEARDKLSLVSTLASPQSPSDLYVSIQPLVIMFGPPDFGQDAEGKTLQRAWFDIYASTLKEHPKEAIEIAVAEWLRVGKPFFPKPSELHKLAEESSAEIRLIAFRLRYAVERADEYRPAPKRTVEQTQEMKAMADKLRGPDGKIHLTQSTADVVPATDRSATAAALRRLAGY